MCACAKRARVCVYVCACVRVCVYVRACARVYDDYYDYDDDDYDDYYYDIRYKVRMSQEPAGGR